MIGTTQPTWMFLVCASRLRPFLVGKCLKFLVQCHTRSARACIPRACMTSRREHFLTVYLIPSRSTLPRHHDRYLQCLRNFSKRTLTHCLLLLSSTLSFATVILSQLVCSPVDMSTLTFRGKPICRYAAEVGKLDAVRVVRSKLLNNILRWSI